MTVGAFSEWHRLPVNLSELCINTTLRCGQSFRWHKVPDSDEWRCVLQGCLLSLKQDPSHLYYRTYRSATPPSNPDLDEDSTALSLVKHYLNLSSNLTDLYTQWSSQDPNFKKKAPQFTGIRILRQDAWEALISFICSSNNNIARISQMVEKLCTNYGPLIASVGEWSYHDFPPPEALTAEDVESRLRALGFGYRAKYIHQTAVMVAQQREKGWLDSLRNPEAPAFGVEACKPGGGGEMMPGGRVGYREAHEKLLELQGVGPKVADCVCLMGLGWGEAVPVDTHVWQIAQRDYKFGKGTHKSLTKPTYDAVGNHFRKLWGKEAGWAHSVLFTADLKTFSNRLVVTASKKQTKVKADPDVKREDDADTLETVTSTTTVALKKRRSTSVTVKCEPDHDGSDTKVKPLVQTPQTTTRRTSKRLRTR